jgi:hypothetical protein
MWRCAMGISRWLVTTFPMGDKAAARYAARIQRVYGTDIRSAEDPLPEAPVRAKNRKNRQTWRWSKNTT